jgi:polysaccharide biosynthesis protein PslH
MGKGIKILVLCPDAPFPIRAGGQMRMGSLIHALSECGDVKVAFIAPPGIEETASWAQERNISLEHLISNKPSFFELWTERLAILSGGSNLRDRIHERDFFDRVFKSYNPDLVWLETPYLLRYVIKWGEKVPLVVDYWGTSEGSRRVYEFAKGPLKIWKWLYWRAAMKGERRFAPLVQNIVCVSSVNAAYFRDLAKESRIWVIPVGIQTPDPELSSPSTQGDTSILIFTGDMSFLPNIDAAVWFTEEIFPIIQKEVPWAKLQIVGRNPANKILDLSLYKNVEVKGFVSDLSASIVSAGIYILPMRLGSGIRTKLLDVFPLGKAIVSTSIGAEGLELHHNENCLIADSVGEFAEACIRLLKNESDRHRLGEAVRRLTVETYSQKNINRLVLRTITEIAGSQQAG